MPRVILPNVALLLHRFVGLSRFNYLCFFSTCTLRLQAAIYRLIKENMSSFTRETSVDTVQSE